MKTKEKETKVLICLELHDCSCALGGGINWGIPVHSCKVNPYYDMDPLHYAMLNQDSFLIHWTQLVYW